MDPKYNLKLLQAIRTSGWLLEELSGLARIPEPVLYRIITGLVDPDPGTQERLAVVLAVQTADIFEQGEDDA